MTEANLLSLSYGQIVRRDIESVEGLVPASYETYQIVEPGDIVFRLTDLQNDTKSLRSALVTERGVVTSAYLAFRPRTISCRYLNYLMRSYDTTKVFYGMGGGVRQSLNYDQVKRLPILVPPAGEQERICDWLDKETARIDVMVSKQEQLIETLRERHSALVSHMTLGAEKKWTGRVGKVLRKLDRQPDPGAGVVTAYRDGQVTLRSSRREDGYTFSDSESGYQGVCPGDLVFHALDGFAGAVGVCDTEGKCSPVYHVCSPKGGVDSTYLAYHLRALGTAGFLSAFAWSVRQRSVDYRNWTLFASLPVALPSPDEQHKISARLDRQLSRIDTLIANGERFIDLAKERRSALITAAVTGQIDVRESRGLEVVA